MPFASVRISPFALLPLLVGGAALAIESEASYVAAAKRVQIDSLVIPIPMT